MLYYCSWDKLSARKVFGLTILFMYQHCGQIKKTKQAIETIKKLKTVRNTIAIYE